jgi:hypothetical protein
MIQIAATLFVAIIAINVLWVAGIGVASFFAMLEEGMRHKSVPERQAWERRRRADRERSWQGTMIAINSCLVLTVISWFFF